MLTTQRSESLVSETLKYDMEKQGPSSKDSTNASFGSCGTMAVHDEIDPLAEQWQFAPEKGNIVFSSAIDCWGFGTLKFANIWAKKLGINKGVLYKYMFEDYYFNNASKKICKCDPGDSSHVPMAVPLIFEPIWRLYNICITEKDTEKAAKMAERGLGVKLTPREINQRDPRGTLQTIFQKWIPLSEAVLRMVVRCMPSPEVAQGEKEKILFGDTNMSGVTYYSDHSKEGLGLIQEGPGAAQRVIIERTKTTILRCKDSVKQCRTESPAAPVIVFISKMVPMKLTDLAPDDANMIKEQRRQKAKEVALAQGVTVLGPDDESDVLMALGRVFSGTLTKSIPYFVLNHRHRPLGMIPSIERWSEDDWNAAAALGDQELEIALQKHEHLTNSTVAIVPPSTLGLYLCFGPSIKSVPYMPAGNIVGIIGLDQQVLKTGTLSSTLFCPPMRPISFQAKPILRVAVEPTRHQDLAALETGLKALYQYDPVVEVAVEATGEFTISCLGELHLELCLKALSENFAKLVCCVCFPKSTNMTLLMSIFTDAR